jgi:hypothetical protein
VIRAFTFHNRYGIVNVPLNKPIIFDIMISNYGSGYNPLTGIFHADISGWYSFFVDIRVNYVNHICWIDIIRNGERISTTYAMSGGSTHQHNSDSSMAYIHLNVGDRVWIHRVYSSGTCNIDELSTFAGFLLHPLWYKHSYTVFITIQHAGGLVWRCILKQFSTIIKL